MFVRHAEPQQSAGFAAEPRQEHAVTGESPAALAARVGGMVTVEVMSSNELSVAPADRHRRSSHVKTASIDSAQSDHDVAVIRFLSGNELWVSQPPSEIRIGLIRSQTTPRRPVARECGRFPGTSTSPTFASPRCRS